MAKASLGQNGSNFEGWGQTPGSGQGVRPRGQVKGSGQGVRSKGQVGPRVN